ncbi:hypothetical protein PVAND_005589 [Polypedilum vanderplanki]|uniref:Uncharacterized protein n=1 Tax=Polypedilum vanderplanki TaxID=319348 RepID=A0A9J6C0M4_POLVA|nr:hypothetical protein PVAND_005589 [Polypedilum vanderplanki]
MPDAAARLSQADYPYYNIIGPEGPGTYAFGYEIEDPATGNVQFRDEEKFKNGTVRGSYGVLLPDNTLHITRYIADQFGYRASTETKKKTDNGPLKIELQLQPTVSPRPGVVAPVIDQQINNLDSNLLPQKVNANLMDPFMNQYYQVPFYYRQNPYDNTVSTYTGSQSTGFPFFNWFNTNNNNNNNQYQDQAQQPQRPILDFINNIANNNPITSFFNNLNQNTQSEQNMNQNAFQSFFNNINPFNFFNNNNNRPQNSVIPSLPITQGDYIAPSSTTTSGFIQPSGQIDTSVFSNDHFLNPTTFYPNNNPNLISNTYPNSPLNIGYMATTQNRPLPYTQAWPQYNNIYKPYTSNYGYPYEFYNPYQQISPIKYTNNQNKKTRTKSKRKKNKNKVELPSTDSDWFQGFLDKRKEASLVTNSRHTKDSEEDDDIDLDEYFR